MRMPRVTPVAPNISSLLLVNGEGEGKKKKKESREILLHCRFLIRCSANYAFLLQSVSFFLLFFFVEEKGHTMDINKRGYEMRDDYFVT